MISRLSSAYLVSLFDSQGAKCRLRHGHVLISDGIQAELTDVLTRRKFDRYVSQEKRVRFLASFLSLATPFTVMGTVKICRDPKDDKFLDLAISGKADYIVSGDDDLLVLHPFHGTAILTPVEFLQQITIERNP